MRRVRLLLLVLAAGAALVAAASWLTGGLRLAIGPLRLSATSPARVAFEAAALWVVATTLGSSARRWTALVPVAALLVAALADAPPQRIGDGAEYMAMLIQLRHERGPWIAEEDRITLAQELAATPGFDTTPPATVVGPGGSREFYHFWLYPLVVLPFSWLSTAAGFTLNAAFTLANLALLGLVIGALATRREWAAAVLVCASPLLWWLDKAHAEVFLFATLAVAMLTVESSPVVALAAAGLATAQNPAAGVVFATLAVVGLSSRPTRRRLLPGLLLGTSLAALAPAYYWWRLGQWSPLASTVRPELPGLRALLTPVIDFNLGLMVYAPILVMVAAVGVVSASWRTRLAVITACAGLLVVFAWTGNVNHGGSPGVSRYALWLLALFVPLLAAGSRWMVARAPRVLALLTILSVSLSTITFRPSIGDRAGGSPSLLASWTWTHIPGADNPVPEVFAERVSGLDGTAPIPTASANCEKVLTRGDGHDLWWPFPCLPGSTAAAPHACLTDGHLCYVNVGRIVDAPRQSQFTFDASASPAWRSQDRERYAPLLNRLGTDAHLGRVGGSGRIQGRDRVSFVYIVEGRHGLAAWLRPSSDGTGEPQLRVRLVRRARLEQLDPVTFEAHGEVRLLEPGEATIPVDAAGPSLIALRDVEERP